MTDVCPLGGTCRLPPPGQIRPGQLRICRYLPRVLDAGVASLLDLRSPRLLRSRRRMLDWLPLGRQLERTRRLAWLTTEPLPPMGDAPVTGQPQPSRATSPVVT